MAVGHASPGNDPAGAATIGADAFEWEGGALWRKAHTFSGSDVASETARSRARLHVKASSVIISLGTADTDRNELDRARPPE